MGLTKKGAGLLWKFPAQILLELLHLRLDDINAIPCIGVVFEVILMVVLRWVEYIQLFQLGHDGILEKRSCFLDGGLRFFELILVMPHDGGSVLRPHIGTLTIEGGRIMGLPEKLKQSLVGDFVRIVGDLHHFCMTGGPFANGSVSRIFHVASSVAGDHIQDSLDIFQHRFGAPEAAATESGFFVCLMAFFSLHGHPGQDSRQNATWPEPEFHDGTIPLIARKIKHASRPGLKKVGVVLL